MEKGSVHYVPELRAYCTEYARIHNTGIPARGPQLWGTWSQAMSDYRLDLNLQRERVMARSPKATPRAVMTRDGMVLRGDSDHRPGDPIIGPDNRVHYVDTVYLDSAKVPVLACAQDELPLFFD